MSRAFLALFLVASLVSGVLFFTPNYSAEYDEDFYEYVCEYYDYNKSDIRKWKIFKNTCINYVKCLNDV